MEYESNTEKPHSLLALTKHILHQSNKSTITLSLSFYSNALFYMDKYLYIETMSDLLNAMEQACNEETPRAMLAIYEFFRGKEAFWFYKLDDANQYFDAAASYIAPVTRKNATIAFEIYTSLSLCYIIIHSKRAEEYLQSALTVQRMYQLDKSIDTDMEQWILLWFECYHSNPNATIEELLDTSMFEKLMQVTKQTPISKKDFLLGSRALLPAEITTILPNEVLHILTDTFENIQNMDMNSTGDEIYIEDVFKITTDSMLKLPTIEESIDILREKYEHTLLQVPSIEQND